MSPNSIGVLGRMLRSYQVEAVDAVLDTWGSGTQRTAVVLPTGTGKSTVIAEIASRAYELDLRVVMLAHRFELLDQMAATVKAVAPQLPPVGIVAAERDEYRAPIVAASFQTVTRAQRLDRLGRRDVILCDETHHVTAPTYAKVVETLGAYDDSFFCGFTATLRREDGRALRSVIDHVAYERDLRWAIEEGFLVKPTGLTVRVPGLDLDRIRVVAGDFVSSELAVMMEASTESVVDAVLRFAAGRRSLVFAASVLAAEMIADSLCAKGIAAAVVVGSTPQDERSCRYRDFSDGTVSVLVTVQVLTEGVDFPWCDAVVIARPTRSQVLYSQMIGRALRPHPGKSDALVVDLAGATRVLSVVTLADLDAGTTSRTVEADGTEVEPEEDDEVSGPARVKLKRRGPIDMVSIDLLSSNNTGVLWLETVGGIPFMPTGSTKTTDLLVFLWPVPRGVWRAGWLTAKGDREGGWISEPMELGMARDAAEDWLIEEGFKYPRRQANWRGRDMPSDAQLNFARMLGIPDTDDMSCALLSDHISIVLASRRLDPRRTITTNASLLQGDSR